MLLCQNPNILHGQSERIHLNILHGNSSDFWKNDRKVGRFFFYDCLNMHK